MADEPLSHWHEDPEFLREAVTFTAAETGFAARLIEKDYYCTVLLHYLAASDTTLVFRGGTCLAKVHAGFYRLSEDLDFLISVPIDSSRRQRSRRVAAAKAAVADIPERLPGLRLGAPMTGANESTQYAAAITYRSVLGDFDESVKIEIGLREPVLTPHAEGGIRTLLLDPISGTPLLPVVVLPCLSHAEAMAEKLRAALTRREVAIRDFFDLDHADRSGFRLLDPQLLDLARAKLTIPGNDAVDVSPARIAALRRQLEAQLEPVLRPSDYTAFDLDRAVSTVLTVAEALR